MKATAGKRNFILAMLFGAAMTSQVVLAGGVVTAATESDLRAAMVGGGVVTFAVDGTISLTSQLVITNNTTLNGGGHVVVLDGGHARPVMHVSSGVSVTLSNITIANGLTVGDGAGVANYGNLLAVNCTFAGNQAINPVYGTKGGAIYNYGTVSVESCSFLTNSANFGGAIAQDSPLLNTVAVVRNSTFWSNSAPAGAAIGNLQYGSWSQVYQSTFYGQNGIALYGYYNGVNSPSYVYVDTSIVAFSTPFNCYWARGGGSINSDGTLIQSGLPVLNYVDPMLGPLTNNGGTTLTMTPLHGSLAIDMGGSGGFDQRGVSRPVGFRGDCGSVELDFAPGDLHFSTSAYSVNENVGTASIVVTRFGNSLPAGTVNFAVTNGTATPGVDFVTTNGLLTFVAGESNKTFAVQIVNNSVPESAETVKLSLSNPTGGIVFGPGTQATLTIVDEDIPLVVCDEPSLRAAIAVGGLITFGCDGTIVLTNTLNIGSVTLDGAGHDVTISGGNSVRIFYVNAPRGKLTLKNLTIANGMAVGSSGATNASGGSGQGGAAFVAGGALEIFNCRFRTNTALGGTGGPGNPAGAGGGAFGGAIYMALGTVLIATNTEFEGNMVIGGAGGTNAALSSLGLGGVAFGGAIYQEMATGFQSPNSAKLHSCSFIGNQAQGGQGSSLPGTAYGGAIGNSSTCSITNCTLTQNSAIGGQAFGGAIFTTNGTMNLCYNTVAGNSALGYAGFGSGIAAANGTTRILNTIVANNAGGNNIYGTVVDLGHNIASDASGGFSSPTSLSNTDPKLGALASNGGPTRTLPLMPDSPAIGAAQMVTGTTVDQRGIVRPFLALPDIGAYEWNAASFYSDFHFCLPSVTNAMFNGQVLGPPNQSFRVQTTSNFTQWADIFTNVTDNFGFTAFSNSLQTLEPMRFFRLVSP